MNAVQARIVMTMIEDHWFRRGQVEIERSSRAGNQWHPAGRASLHLMTYPTFASSAFSVFSQSMFSGSTPLSAARYSETKSP